MTLEALYYAIERLLIKRWKTKENEEEQKRINAKLTKLYDLKYLMLEQMYRQNQQKTIIL